MTNTAQTFDPTAYRLYKPVNPAYLSRVLSKGGLAPNKLRSAVSTYKNQVDVHGFYGNGNLDKVRGILRDAGFVWNETNTNWPHLDVFTPVKKPVHVSEFGKGGSAYDPYDIDIWTVTEDGGAVHATTIPAIAEAHAAWQAERAADDAALIAKVEADKAFSQATAQRFARAASTSSPRVSGIYSRLDDVDSNALAALLDEVEAARAARGKS